MNNIVHSNSNENSQIQKKKQILTTYETHN